MGVFSIRKTQAEFESEVAKSQPSLKIIGEYTGRNKPVKTKCLIDGYEWYPQAYNLVVGHGCPVCSGRTVLKGVNDVATTHPNILPYLVNISDGYKFTAGSHSYIDFKCPRCLNIRNLQIKSVISQGFACPVCDDKVSYPNKFARALLQQLPVSNVIHEYSPEWAGRYKYDNYFVHDNKQYILEMDGTFHYKNNTMSGMTKSQAQDIDKYKERLASDNGINVIRIESLKSEPNYLKNKFYDSLFNELFDLSKIDWEKCDDYTSTSEIEETSKYYEANKFIKSKTQIAKDLNIGVDTLARRLKIGKSVGWVKIDTEESFIRSLTYNNPKSKAIVVKEINTDNIIYEFKSINLCIKFFKNVLNINISSNGINYAIKRKNGDSKGVYHGYRFEYL